MICQVCGHGQDRGRFCGHCGARVEAAERPAEVRPWTRPERWVPTAVALLVLALALGRLLGPGGSDGGGATPPPAAAGGPVFPAPTGTVLFLDDGTGAVGLDLDTGTTERLELSGQATGDRSSRLWRLGPHLVVAQEDAVVVAPGVDGATRTFGTATRFLPAADPQQLWLLDVPDTTGPDGGEDGAWTLVAATGRTVTSIAAIPGYEPVRGLPRGLALRDGTGRLWRYDIAEDVLVEALGGASPSWIGDVVRSQVAWCPEDPCRRLSVADAGGADPVGIGDGESFAEGQVWLAPAGDQVAAVVLAPATDGASLDRRLRVYRTATGEVLADAQVPLGEASGSWTVDGRQFFGWVQASGDDAPAALLRWAGTGIELVDARSFGVADVRAIVAVPGSAMRGVARRGGETCAESERSDAMGSLPAWRDEQVHVALIGPVGDELPDQLWVGIPGAGNGTAVTVSARRADGEAQAGFRSGNATHREWQPELTLRSGLRTAEGFPPHWGLASRFPEPGCWEVTVSTEELTEVVTIDVRSDVG